MKRTNGFSSIRPFAVEKRRVFCTPDGSPIGKRPEPQERVEASKAMSANDIRAELDSLADRARRLPPPMSNNPSAFHEAKSELARDIGRLADALRTGATI